MSTSSFDPVSFLMKINPAMLAEYAKFHGIDLEFEKNAERSEAAARKTLALVEQQSGEIQGNFFNDIGTP